MQTVSNNEQSRHRIFISYSSSDRRQVDGLERLLTLLGHEVFMDCKTIRLGARWKDEIHAALERTDVTLVFWTRSASLSSWVRSEYEYLLAHCPDRPLVPIVGDSTPLAEPLKERQALNLLPIFNELVDLKRSMEQEGRGKSEIQAAIRSRLEESGISLEESDLKRIFRFFGVAGWLGWLPAPLLLFDWIWRSLFEAVAQLSTAQAAIVVMSAAASAAVAWQAGGDGGDQAADERQRRVAIESELAQLNQSNRVLSSHAQVDVRGIKQPTAIQLTNQESESRYTVVFPSQQDLHLMIPPGPYQADYALPTQGGLAHPVVDNDGALLSPARLKTQQLRGGAKYTLVLPETLPDAGVASSPNPAGGNPEPSVPVTGDSVIETVAGMSAGGDDDWGKFGGDSGPATEALLNNPAAVAVARDGSIYVADADNHRVRRIAPVGVISTFAGTGAAGFSGDGGLAIKARLKNPRGVSLGPDGSLYVYDRGNYRVRKIDQDGIIDTVAGGGTNGLGDGEPATEAQLSPVESGPGGFYRDNSIAFPMGLQVARDGSLFLVDGNQRVRRVDAGGLMWTYAGGGEADAGAEGPATEARLDRPNGIALAPDGALFIADNKSIRKVSPAGAITTVISENAADRGISAVAIGPKGSLYFCEADFASASNDGHGVRRLLANGQVVTIVGDGQRGNSGDGGPAKNCAIQGPTHLAVAADGTLYFCDSGNHRIRRILPAPDSR